MNVPTYSPMLNVCIELAWSKLKREVIGGVLADEEELLRKIHIGISSFSEDVVKGYFRQFYRNLRKTYLMEDL